MGAGKPEICTADQLETQVRVDVALLSLKSTGQVSGLKTQAGFLCCSLKAELLLFWRNFSLN